MTKTDRFPWTAVSALVSFVVVSAVAWLQIPTGSPSVSGSAKMPTLRFGAPAKSGAGDLLAERLEAYDPTPLFLPAPMSSNDPPLRGDARNGLAGPFAPLPPELTKTGPTQVGRGLSPRLTPLDGLHLTEAADAPLALARKDNAQTPLQARLGRMQAVDMASGQTVLTLNLPASFVVPLGDWQPIEIMGAVTPAGLVGDLVVTASSGSDEIDEFFRSYLRAKVWVGARLPPGFYEFLVGP